MSLVLEKEKLAKNTVPSNWRVCRIADHATVVRGGSPRPSGDPRYFNGDFIPWVTVGSLTGVSESQQFVTKTKTFLTEAGSEQSRILEKGTLILGNSGFSLGVAKILGIKCCANDGIAALLNLNGVNARFLCYVLNTMTEQLRKGIARGNDQPNLNTTLIGGIEFFAPEEEEQRAIAEALSDVDALINALDALITKKRHIKQGTMQQLLTGKKRLPGFSGEWPANQLATLALVGRGKFTARPRNDPKYYGGTIPFVQTGDVTRTSMYVNSYSQTLNQLGLTVSKKFPAGTILFTIAANIGDVAITTFATACPDSLVAIQPYESMSKEWLFYALQYRKSEFESLATQNAQANLNLEKIKPFEIATPTLDEQTAIAEVLSDMDAEIMALEQKRDKTKLIKQGMMQELLTGKTRLI